MFITSYHFNWYGATYLNVRIILHIGLSFVVVVLVLAKTAGKRQKGPKVIAHSRLSPKNSIPLTTINAPENVT